MNRIFIVTTLATALFLMASQAFAANDMVRSGQNIVVEEGETVKNVVVIGGSVKVKGNAKDVVAIGGRIDVQGQIRNAVAIGGSARVSGKTRDVAAIGGNVYLEAGAEVKDVLSIGGHIVTDSTAIISGDVMEVGNIQGLKAILPPIARRAFTPEGRDKISGFLFFAKIIYKITVALVVIALGALLMIFFLRHIESISHNARNSIWQSVLIGLFGLICVGPLMVLIGITIIGIPLVPLVGLAAFVAMFLGYIAVTLVIGKEIPLKIKGKSPILELAIGAIILALVNQIPYLGWLTLSAAIALGFGAVLTSKFGTVRIETVRENGEAQAS